MGSAHLIDVELCHRLQIQRRSGSSSKISIDRLLWILLPAIRAEPAPNSGVDGLSSRFDIGAADRSNVSVARV
jgi:hypothetical protein